MSDENGRSEPVDLAHIADFNLGGLEVSPSRRQVVRGDDRETLEPRVMQVLVALWQANGQVVSRDDLIARCWEGRIVGESAINRVTSLLRKLSESNGGVDFSIETIPRVGYRLTAGSEVGPLGRRSETEIEAARPMLRWRWATSRASWAVMSVVLATGAGLWLSHDRLPWVPGPREARVAVLPFDIVGPGRELHGLADGLADEIVGQLSDSQTQVVSPAESKTLRGKGPEAIDRLGADMVLDGTVQGDGKAIDVRIHLNDVREHVVLWSGEFHGSADATETLEASVAAQAADVLYWARTGRSGKVKLDAATFAAFIAGREGTTGVRNTGDGVDLADYRKVVAAAPDFSWGHSGVAAMEGFELRNLPALYAGNDALRTDARLEAKRALALDPHNGEAWMALELSAPLRDWQGREALLLHGIAADPNFEPIAMMEGRLLWAVGRDRDARVWLRRAHDINPLFNGATWSLAINLASEDRLAESRAIVARMELQWPDHDATKNARFWTNVLTGATDDALALLADSPTRPPEMDQKSADAWRAALKASASKDPAVKTGAIRAVMEAASAGSLEPGQALTLLAMLGDLDGAFAQAQLYEPLHVSALPYLFLSTTAPMRSDPRFIPLARKLGLVTYWRATGHWPDFCSEPGLPYDCHVEATKVVAQLRRP